MPYGTLLPFIDENNAWIRLRLAPHHSPICTAVHPGLAYATGTPRQSLRGREKVSLYPCILIAPWLPHQGLWITLIAPAMPSSRRSISRFSTWERPEHAIHLSRSNYAWWVFTAESCVMMLHMIWASAPVNVLLTRRRRSICAGDKNCCDGLYQSAIFIPPPFPRFETMGYDKDNTSTSSRTVLWLILNSAAKYAIVTWRRQHKVCQIACRLSLMPTLSPPSALIRINSKVLK